MNAPIVLASTCIQRLEKRTIEPKNRTNPGDVQAIALAPQLECLEHHLEQRSEVLYDVCSRASTKRSSQQVEQSFVRTRQVLIQQVSTLSKLCPMGQTHLILRSL